ncbi:GNAT family N-acetyltransferase [bacterium]|nr:GNAT family N-acetyltransferase [bacterium]
MAIDTWSQTINKSITILSEIVEMNLVHELEEMIFNDHRTTEAKLEKIKNNQPLLLVAYDGKLAIGFKLGYAIPGTRRYYSWLGGVRKDYRRQGIAQELLDRQEQAAGKMAMEKVFFTSYDRFPGMISLGKKNGYHLIRSELDKGEVKYWYEKVIC